MNASLRAVVKGTTAVPSWVWWDGSLRRREDVRVDPLSHALHYGTAVFEGIRCYDTVRGPALFRLDDHLRRLVAGARVLGIDLRNELGSLANACRMVVRENGFRSAYVRPLVFYGAGGMGFHLRDQPVHRLVAAWEWGAYMGEEGRRRGIALRTSTWRKVSAYALPTDAKIAGAYANTVLAFQEARSCGGDEALLLNERGDVAEGSGENVFAVERGVVVTPPTSDTNLPGITRDTVAALASGLGYEVVERTLTSPELAAADEVFLAGTAAEVTPVRSLDGIPIGTGRPGPVTRRLQQAFSRAVRGERHAQASWLTYVDEEPTALNGGI